LAIAILLVLTVIVAWLLVSLCSSSYQAPNKNRPQSCVYGESRRAENHALSAQPTYTIVAYWTGEIVHAVSNIRPEIADDGQHVEGLKKFVAYINKQWINKRSVRPERLSVRDN